MDAKTFYRIIFVGNEPYKNRRRELNNLKRWVHQLGAELQEDDGLNLIMLKDLAESMSHYVRKSILGVFKILIFQISKPQKSKFFVIEIQNTPDQYGFLNYTFNQDEYNSKFSIFLFNTRQMS